MWVVFIEAGLFILIMAAIAWLVIPRKPKK
jgi:phage shock protein PspC (stress-responsive transcriptional regulator)